ncbi:hypothetical protein PR048_008405 [Dryococelus australis]|uniref:TFIIS N-terminal domain-containing protein n=1 Tax=Dryococelus australis TaxID=614101 RepID=A0ABQ9HX17_9NEOP|nr:hypothetical protein PR048_008405 [Dryococelus australis]
MYIDIPVITSSLVLSMLTLLSVALPVIVQWWLFWLRLSSLTLDLCPHLSLDLVVPVRKKSCPMVSQIAATILDKWKSMRPLGVTGLSDLPKYSTTSMKAKLISRPSSASSTARKVVGDKGQPKTSRALRALERRRESQLALQQLRQMSKPVFKRRSQPSGAHKPGFATIIYCCRGATVVYWSRLLAFHLGKPGSIPGLSHVGIMPDSATGQQVFSGSHISPRPYIPALLHCFLVSPSSTLKTSMLRAAQISTPPLTADQESVSSKVFAFLYKNVWTLTSMILIIEKYVFDHHRQRTRAAQVCCSLANSVSEGKIGTAGLILFGLPWDKYRVLVEELWKKPNLSTKQGFWNKARRTKMRTRLWHLQQEEAVTNRLLNSLRTMD